MSKVYVLKYGYNQYDQLGGYAIAIWKDKPDFHKIKEWFEKEGDCVHESAEEYARDLGYDYDKDYRYSIYGKLSRGEEVSVEGGHTLIVTEEEAL